MAATCTTTLKSPASGSWRTTSLCLTNTQLRVNHRKIPLFCQLYIFLVYLVHIQNRPSSCVPPETQSLAQTSHGALLTSHHPHPIHPLFLHNDNKQNLKLKMCIMKTYETRGRTVVEPPPRRSNFTSHPPAGVMRLPREWRRSESIDSGRYIEYRQATHTPLDFTFGSTGL